MGSLQPGNQQPTGVPKASVELASALERMGIMVVSPRGTVLFRPGQQPNGVFVVRKGRVRLSLHCADGQLTYRTVGPGYILGLPATVSDQPYSLTAETVEDSEFASVDRKRVLSLLRRRSGLSFQVVTILADEVRRMRKQAGTLARGAGRFDD
jgi:CRP/FNR family transcriptional regulator, cyclic AMP receptor protein